MNLRLLGLVFMLFEIVYSLPSNKIQTRVYRGKPAKLKDFPFQVNLLLKKYSSSTDSSECSGALISDSHVLTAAHCFYPNGTTGTFLGYGEAIFGDITRNGALSNDAELRIFGQADIIVHDGYTTLKNNDIALIILPQSVPIKAKIIEPVRLPSRSQGSLVGKVVTVAGWGNMNDRSQKVAKFLLYTRLNIVDDLQCKIFDDYETDVKICAKGNNTSTCSGDSGSGYTITEDDGIKTIVGVVSGGIDRCEDRGPEFMSSVNYNLAWIYLITRLPVRH